MLKKNISGILVYQLFWSEFDDFSYKSPMY